MSAPTVPEPLQKYPFLMYESSQIKNLRTGDVLHLNLETIKTLLKYENSLEPLFSHFSKDLNYQSNYWAILNKTCDMVYDKDGGRFFKNNLIIAPLIGFKNFVRRDYLGDVYHKSKEVQSITKLYSDNFRKFLEIKLRNEEKPTKENYSQWVQAINKSTIDPALSSLEQAIDSIKEYDDNNHEQIVKDLLMYYGQSSSFELIKEFLSSGPFQKSVGKHKQLIAESIIPNSILVIKSDRNSADKISKFCLNQYDNDGFFYYEPHPALSNSFDLSFAIKLDDILSIKLKNSHIESGEVQKILLAHRQISLTYNFTDRLLNIMGNYFSKIATSDVYAPTVLSLYKDVQGQEFFTELKDYETYCSKPKTP